MRVTTELSGPIPAAANEGETTMQPATSYKIIVLDHVGALWAPPTDYSFINDDEALNFARARLNGHVVEVWEGGRLVRRLMPGQDELAMAQSCISWE